MYVSCIPLASITSLLVLARIWKPPGTGLNMSSPYRPVNKESWDRGPSVCPEAGVEVQVKVGVAVGETKLSSPAPAPNPAAAAVLVTNRSAGIAQGH